VLKSFRFEFLQAVGRRLDADEKPNGLGKMFLVCKYFKTVAVKGFGESRPPRSARRSTTGNIMMPDQL